MVDNSGKIEYVTKHMSTGEITYTSIEKSDQTVSATEDIQVGELPDDALEASIQPTSIIGVDSRVTVSDVSKYPYKCIVQLVIDFPDSTRGYATGFVIGSKYIMTAGHNIYQSNRGGWAEHVIVYAGGVRNGQISHPYTYSTDISTSLGIVENASNKEQYDWAIIETNLDIADYTGTLSYKKATDSELSSGTGYIAGFDYEAGYDFSEDEAPMLKDNGPLTSVISPNRFRYKIDTTAGYSGAPVMKKINSKYVAVGIHTHGKTITTNTNIGCRFFSDLYDIMVALE